MKRFLKYFLQGLIIVIPVFFTIYVIYTSMTWIDNFIPSLFNESWFPGVGLIFMISLITVFGYLGSTLIAKPIFSVIENSVYKVPLINLIYSSTKDLMGALVGEKKKFNQPVLVNWNKDSNIYRIGFITQVDLKYLDLVDKVAVYFPDSYNISGNLFIVSKEHVKVINVPSSEIMKFIVSGGVSGLNH